jgi:hypothetical protein
MYHLDCQLYRGGQCVVAGCNATYLDLGCALDRLFERHDGGLTLERPGRLSGGRLRGLVWRLESMK